MQFSRNSVACAALRRIGALALGHLVIALPAAAQTGLVLTESLTDPAVNLTQLVAAHGNRVVASSAAGMRLFVRTGNTWADPVALPDPAGVSGISALVMDGDLLVRGMNNAVAIYEGETLVATLLGAFGGQQPPNSGFGADIDVAVGGGATRVVVGARTWPAAAGTAQGAVLVFERDGGEWNPVALLQVPAGDGADQLGRLVAIAGNGRIAAVSRIDNPAGVGKTGRLFIWESDGTGGWTLATSIDMSSLGADLAMANWGIAAAAGNRVEIFDRVGGVWSTRLLPAPGVPALSSVDVAGTAVAAGGRGFLFYWPDAGLDGLPPRRTSNTTGSLTPNFAEGVALAGQSILASWKADRSGAPQRGSILLFQAGLNGCEAVQTDGGTVQADASAQVLGIGISAQPAGCTWWASTSREWLHPEMRTGTGDLFEVELEAHPGGGPLNFRHGIVSFGSGDSTPVNQFRPAPASGCSVVTLDRYEQTVAADGGAFDVRVFGSPDGCVWATSSGTPWLSASPLSGSGVDWATVTVEGHAAATERRGTVVLGGRSFEVIQTGAAQALACSSTVVTNTTLNADVDCTALGMDETGITLGHGVTLDLNGFAVLGPGGTTPGAVGVLIEGTRSAVIGGTIRDFHVGVAAIDPDIFPLDHFSDLAEVNGSEIGGRTDRRARRAIAEIHDVAFVDNDYGVLGYGADVDVKDSVFEGHSSDAVAHEFAGTLLVRNSQFVGNRTGVDVETDGNVRIEDNAFSGQARPALQLAGAARATVTGNLFDGNNTDPDPGRDFGQVNLRLELIGPVTIRCNTFFDDTHNGVGALDPYPTGPGSGAPPGGHAAVAIGEPSGDSGGSPRAARAAALTVLENDFRTGDAGVVFETGGTGVASVVEVSRNNFLAGLTLAVGFREDAASTWAVGGSGNYFAPGLLQVIDPGGNAPVVSISGNAATANACSLRTAPR